LAAANSGPFLHFNQTCKAGNRQRLFQAYNEISHGATTDCQLPERFPRVLSTAPVVYSKPHRVLENVSKTASRQHSTLSVGKLAELKQRKKLL